LPKVKPTVSSLDDGRRLFLFPSLASVSGLTRDGRGVNLSGIESESRSWITGEEQKSKTDLDNGGGTPRP
jgi:hypothetical protein